MRTSALLTAGPAPYITISTLVNNRELDILGWRHSIRHAVTTKWKDEGSYMTGAEHRSWANRPCCAVNQPISWAFLISGADSVNRCFGNGTYTVWVSSCGLSACSGNTGCGGSPMGTQPSDLLIAWLSFLAGDFCEEGGTNTWWVLSTKHF